MTNKKGFTLIELLVVIGIIGVLATIGIASLSTAQKKARDTKRISDVKQISTIIEVEDSSTPSQPLVGCAAKGAGTYTCSEPGEIKRLAEAATTSNFRDPGAATSVAACSSASTTPCTYSIADAAGTGAPLTSSYQICFFLEAGTAGLKGGKTHAITSGATFKEDCNF